MSEPSLTLRWRRRAQGRRRAVGRWLALPLLLSGLGSAALLVHAHTGSDGFERRLEAGCDELEPCQALEAEASERLTRCTLVCGREREQQREARHLLYRAEERRRVREHYRQSEALEGRRLESERERQIEDEERAQAARARVEERLRKDQLEAERLERERQEVRLAEQRARELRYASLLSPALREQRLTRCHERLAACDALVELLLDAASDDRERRRLVELNERALQKKYAQPDEREGASAATRRSASTPVAAAPQLPATPAAEAWSVDACAGRTEGCCEAGGIENCPGS
jgi:hypothetical protein